MVAVGGVHACIVIVLFVTLFNIELPDLVKLALGAPIGGLRKVNGVTPACNAVNVTEITSKSVVGKLLAVPATYFTWPLAVIVAGVSKANDTVGKIEEEGALVADNTCNFVLSKLKKMAAASSEPEIKCTLTFTVKLCPLLTVADEGLNTRSADCAYELIPRNKNSTKEKRGFLFKYIRLPLTNVIKSVEVFMFTLFTLFYYIIILITDFPLHIDKNC
jgi:hypothetical protein